jgi:hypothetical protein
MAKSHSFAVTGPSWMTFRRPRRCTCLILAAAAAFMTVTATGASSYRPSAFPLTFEILPAVPCHAYWEFLSRPALQGLLTKEEKELADLFCPAT